jgi:uncharacterized membrane protein YbhN (UPF0104 family)
LTSLRTASDRGGEPEPSQGLRPKASPWGHALRTALSVLSSLVLFALALWILRRWLHQVSLEELQAEMEQVSATQVGLALVFTFLSFVALAGYEIYAVHYAGRRLPGWRVWIYSFITQSIVHAAGFAIVLGLSLRYKLYLRHGLTLLDAAKIQAFFTMTFALGTATLAGIVLLLHPDVPAAATSITDPFWRGIGLTALVGVAALLVWSGPLHRPVRVMGISMVLPSARITMIQIMLGIADLAAVAGALHALMPPELQLGYLHVLAIFVVAISIGLISHVPGSLGVFESTVMLLISPSDDLVAPLVSSLILFRAIYYILPLVCGALLFGSVVALDWRRGQRATSP